MITNVEKMAKSKNNTVSEQKTTAKVNGFNSIFAVASIPAAIAYYNELKKQMEETGHKLNIATIFSFNPNEEDHDDILQHAVLIRLHGIFLTAPLMTIINCLM